MLDRNLSIALLPSFPGRKLSVVIAFMEAESANCALVLLETAVSVGLAATCTWNRRDAAYCVV